jgi:hypothetical protein
MSVLPTCVPFLLQKLIVVYLRGVTIDGVWISEWIY